MSLSTDLSDKLDASKLTFSNAFTSSLANLHLYWNDNGSVLGFEIRLNANTLLRVQFNNTNSSYFYSNDNGATWNTFWNK